MGLPEERIGLVEELPPSVIAEGFFISWSRSETKSAQGFLGIAAVSEISVVCGLHPRELSAAIINTA